MRISHSIFNGNYHANLELRVLDIVIYRWFHSHDLGIFFTTSCCLLLFGFLVWLPEKFSSSFPSNEFSDDVFTTFWRFFHVQNVITPKHGSSLTITIVHRLSNMFHANKNYNIRKKEGIFLSSRRKLKSLWLEIYYNGWSGFFPLRKCKLSTKIHYNGQQNNNVSSREMRNNALFFHIKFSYTLKIFN